MERNKDADFVDFAFDNIATFSTVATNMRTHIREIWDVAPDALYNILMSIYNCLEKIIMKLRTYILLKITQDIVRLDIDKKIWCQCCEINDISKFMNDIRDQFEDREEKIICSTIKQYIKKDLRDGFLAYCIEKQGSPKFCRVRKKIAEELCISEDTETVTCRESVKSEHQNEICIPDFSCSKRKGRKNSDIFIKKCDQDDDLDSIIDEIMSNKYE